MRRLLGPAFTALAALAMPLTVLADGCMEGAPDRDALIQCSKYELVVPENRAADALARLRQRYASDISRLARLNEDARAWDDARNTRCVQDTHAALALSGAQPLDGDRAMLLCLRQEFSRRAAELEALEKMQ